MGTNNRNNNSESKKYELLATHVEMFRRAFAAYLEQCLLETGESGELTEGTANGIIFEELLCSYYQTVISALKKLAFS